MRGEPPRRLHTWGNTSIPIPILVCDASGPPPPALTRDDRTAVEVGGEELDVESGAHQDDPEVLVSRQKVTQHDQQEVAEPVPLVNLVLRETAENASSAFTYWCWKMKYCI